MSWYRDKIILILGFLSISFGVFRAHSTPATTYELSLYQSTPLAFWISFGIALTAGGAIALTTISPMKRHAAIISIIVSILAFILLPIIRGYHYYSHPDGMTHLGWSRDILSGALALDDLIYPALQSMTIFLSKISDFSLETSIYLAAISCIMIWLIFISLSCRRIDGRPIVTVFGVLAAATLLPINPVNVSIQAHPASSTIFLSSLFLFIIILADDHNWADLSTVFLVLIVSLGLHQWHVMILIPLLFFLAIFIIVRRYSQEHHIPRDTSIRRPIVVIGILGLVTWLWIENQSTFTAFLAAIVTRITLALGNETGNIGGTQTASVAEIGNLGIFIIKVTAKFVIFGCLSFFSFSELYYRRNTHIRSILYALTIASIPILIGMIAFAILGQLHYLARYAGLLMAPGTLLGILGLVVLHDRLTTMRSQQVATAVISVILAFLLITALPVAFADPYTLNSNGHISEGQFQGYESAFEYADDDTVFVHIRSESHRFHDAIYGTVTQRDQIVYRDPESGERQGQVPDRFGEGALAAEYNDPVYLAITAADYERETRLYKGFRYSESDFENLQNDTSAVRVVDNGQFELYRVE